MRAALHRERDRQNQPFICPWSPWTQRLTTCLDPRAAYKPNHRGEKRPFLDLHSTTAQVGSETWTWEKDLKSVDCWDRSYRCCKEPEDTATTCGKSYIMIGALVYYGNIYQLHRSSDFRWGCVDPMCLQHKQTKQKKGLGLCFGEEERKQPTPSPRSSTIFQCGMPMLESHQVFWPDNVSTLQTCWDSTPHNASTAW